MAPTFGSENAPGARVASHDVLTRKSNLSDCPVSPFKKGAYGLIYLIYHPILYRLGKLGDITNKREIP